MKTTTERKIDLERAYANVKVQENRYAHALLKLLIALAAKQPARPTDVANELARRYVTLVDAFHVEQNAALDRQWAALDAEEEAVIRAAGPS